MSERASEPKRYRRKAEVVGAVQWHKPGDHPDVAQMSDRWDHTHWFSLVDGDDVLAGDWIVTQPDGSRSVVPDTDFRRDYEPADAATGGWIATADRLPSKPGLVLGAYSGHSWTGGHAVIAVHYSEDFGWMDGDCPMETPDFWMPMPAPPGSDDAATGPGEATRKIIAELAKGLNYSPGESWVQCGRDEGAILYKDIIAALRECGIEVEP